MHACDGSHKLTDNKIYISTFIIWRIAVGNLTVHTQS